MSLPLSFDSFRLRVLSVTRREESRYRSFVPSSEHTDYARRQNRKNEISIHGLLTVPDVISDIMLIFTYSLVGSIQLNIHS